MNWGMIRESSRVYRSMFATSSGLFVCAPSTAHAVPLPRHNGEGFGIYNGILASPVYGGSGERSKPMGACSPPLSWTYFLRSGCFSK